MIRVFGIPSCDKIRATRKWFRKHGIEHDFTDLKKKPLKDSELRKLVEKLGLNAIINKRGMTWRNLGLAGKELTDEELFALLLEHQTMIRRPLLQKGESVKIGYDEDSFAEFTA